MSFATDIYSKSEILSNGLTSITVKMSQNDKICVKFDKFIVQNVDTMQNSFFHALFVHFRFLNTPNRYLANG